MKFKQLNPKSVRPSSTTNLSSSNLSKHRVRCSLCDSLLKASTAHRYFLLGKSIHDQLDENVTYGQCCQQYLKNSYTIDKCQMICPKCCQNLHELYLLYKNANELTNKIRQTWSKTKRLNRTRHMGINHIHAIENPSSTSSAIDLTTDTVKEEIDHEQMPINLKTTNGESLDHLPNNQRIAKSTYDIKFSQQLNGKITNGLKSKPHTSSTNNQRKSHIPSSIRSFLPVKQPKSSSNTDEQEVYTTNNFSYQSIVDSQPNTPYAQLMIDSPSSSSSNQQQIDDRKNNNPSVEQIVSFDQSFDGEQSVSPHTNDDDTISLNGSKATRLSRRQYDFQTKLPDQQSLNTFIETSSAESGSRWTWRRTSANSRGYKVYYVCNFSMRRHYHPCPAAMYALFHPEGSISIYSCGQHQHIPKDRLPVSITDATKDEIFKCLQAGMSTTDIREHLTRLQLPYGDTRKLNNFIKYHKELLRFGTVTNVRIGGTAYRQPQCWAIRRQAQAANNESTPLTNSSEDH